MEANSSRKIGERVYDQKGPLLLVICQIHGNEPAGTYAMERLFEMIDREWELNPAFQFRGKLVGLRGNLVASHHKKRYMEHDLNRLWKEEFLKAIDRGESLPWPIEEAECIELNKAIRQEIAAYEPTELILLDLHTTTAKGGIFTIPTRDPRSQLLAQSLHAPIVHGLAEDLEGTLAAYASKDPWGVSTYSLIFEAGQHEDPLSIEHSISALVYTLKGLGMVDEKDVEHFHAERLSASANGVPKETRLLYRHRIQGGDNFHMLPGFSNFMRIEKGQLLAYDKEGPIASPHDAIMLMPLYQHQGEDGFFLLEEV